MSKILLYLLIAIAPLWGAIASSTRTIDADSIRSSDASKTFTLPSTTGTLALAYTEAQELPSGTINGVNVTFTLAHTPKAAASVKLYLDGIYLYPGASYDYTISGVTITMNVAPATGQELTADYEY